MTRLDETRQPPHPPIRDPNLKPTSATMQIVQQHNYGPKQHVRAVHTSNGSEHKGGRAGKFEAICPRGSGEKWKTRSREPLISASLPTPLVAQNRDWIANDMSRFVLYTGTGRPNVVRGQRPDAGRIAAPAHGDENSPPLAHPRLHVVVRALHPLSAPPRTVNLSPLKLLF